MDNTAAPDVDKLYDQAAHCDKVVAEKAAAYHEATRQRGACYLALKRSGESLYAMGKRLTLSTSRVSQIVAKAEKDAAPEKEAGETT